MGSTGQLNYGVAIGIVVDNEDPDFLGRVRLRFPWIDSSVENNWARIATLMAGNHGGTYFLPEVGAEVLVSFDHGDITQPYVIGALWNGKDKPPGKNADEKNNMRMIKSKSGHEISFIDEPGSEKVEIHTKSGHQVILDDSAGKERIEIKDKTGSNSILIDSTLNSISLSSLIKIAIHASIVEINGDATLTLRGGLVKIN